MIGISQQLLTHDIRSHAAR